MRSLTLTALALALVAASFAAGCGSDAKPAARYAQNQGIASDGSANTAAKPARQDTASPTSGSVHIDARIVAACGDIPLAHFAFDSARVQPEAQGSLDALARCFVSGKLAGRSMKLIGHTDPRGETEYNLALGQRRAGSVSDYLGGRGMSKDHLASSSRGEFDATGTDEQGWARDRKVDVLLAD
jgi:peptidoglycan-associated lipoprotein